MVYLGGRLDAVDFVGWGSANRRAYLLLMLVHRCARIHILSTQCRYDEGCF